VTEEETAAKLKARVDRWQTYIQQSKALHENASGSGEGGEPAVKASAPANLYWLGAEVTDVPDSAPAAEPPLPVISANLPVYTGSAQSQEHPLHSGPHDSALSGLETDAAAAVLEARVAELREAVEHEREQARRLADTVTRQQVLHAMSLQTQAALHTQGAASASAATAAGAPRTATAAPSPPHAVRPNSGVTGFPVSGGVRRDAGRAKADTSRQSIIASLIFFVFLFGFLIFALINW
jgi:hypothetical protein